MKFADFFARAFSAVSSAQFPWIKMFKESTVAKIADVSFRNFYENYVFFVLYSQSSLVLVDDLVR